MVRFWKHNQYGSFSPAAKAERIQRFFDSRAVYQCNVCGERGTSTWASDIHNPKTNHKNYAWKIMSGKNWRERGEKIIEGKLPFPTDAENFKPLFQEVPQ